MSSIPAPEARYRTVFDRHYEQVYAYFRRRIDMEAARDCTAETFVIAWRKVGDIPEGSELRWLYMVARNVLRNAYRAKRRSRLTFGGLSGRLDNADSPETIVVRNEEDDEVIEALHRLRRNDQEILLLSVWEELPRDEVAVILGCSPHAASQRLHRASRRLAAELNHRRPPSARFALRREEGSS
jgi:RNA polymerase sigma-70 factor (ECF subfamily)